MNQWQFWMVILAGAIVSAAGAVLVEHYLAQPKEWWLLLISAVTLVFIVYLYLLAFSYKNGAIGYTLMKIISVLLVFFYYLLVFKIKISTMNIIGIVFACVAIGLLSS